MQRPTHDDPVVARASEVVGGPLGEHASPHRWWTPLRVVLAIAAVTFLLGMLQKTPCVVDDWRGSDAERYGAMCYSDLPYLYAPRGFAERELPYTSDRYAGLEYPVLTGYFMYGAAVVTQALHGWPDMDARHDLFPNQIAELPAIPGEMQSFFQVNAVMLAAVALIAAWLLVRANRRRPWDLAMYAASPCLAVAGLINWDYLPVCAVAGFLFAWSRGRPGWAGIALGLGAAAKLYPAFLLGALFAICLRRRQLERFWPAALAALGSWLVVNLPAMVTDFSLWKNFWGFNSDRGADLGSTWLAWQQVSGHVFSPSTMNRVSMVVFVLACLGILALVLRAPQPARLAQVAFLVVTAFVVVNKVYSPQYVMWLLPLAVLARPRVRDQVIWQSGELFYFAACWMYLDHYTASATGSTDVVYTLAIAGRVLAELWLAAVVIRDIRHPSMDVVGADPLWPDFTAEGTAATLERSSSSPVT